MREYFEEWIAYFRYLIEQYIRDKEQAKRESDEMKALYPTPRVKEKSFSEHNKMVEEFVANTKFTEFDRFRVGCLTVKVMEETELTAEELFAKRKSGVEGGHVTQMELEEMKKRYEDMK